MVTKIVRVSWNRILEIVKASVGVARVNQLTEVDLTHFVPKRKELSLKSILIKSGIELRNALIRELNDVSISGLKQDELWDFYNHVVSSIQYMEELNTHIKSKINR